jgi:flagellar hook-length control protein FliK
VNPLMLLTTAPAGAARKPAAAGEDTPAGSFADLLATLTGQAPTPQGTPAPQIPAQPGPDVGAQPDPFGPPDLPAGAGAPPPATTQPAALPAPGAELDAQHAPAPGGGPQTTPVTPATPTAPAVETASTATGQPRSPSQPQAGPAQPATPTAEAPTVEPVLRPAALAAPAPAQPAAAQAAPEPVGETDPSVSTQPEPPAETDPSVSTQPEPATVQPGTAQEGPEQPAAGPATQAAPAGQPTRAGTTLAPAAPVSIPALPAHVVSAVHANTHRLVIRLDPADLGTVHLTLTRTDDGLAVQVRAAAHAHAALVDVERAVRAQLDQAGLVLTGWDVQTNDRASDRPAGGGGATGDTADDHPGTPGHRRQPGRPATTTPDPAPTPAPRQHAGTGDVWL